MRIIGIACLLIPNVFVLAGARIPEDEPVDPGALLQEVRASLQVLGENRDALEELSENCAKAWSAGREAGYAKEPSGVSEMVRKLSWLNPVIKFAIPGRVESCKLSIEEIARYVLLAKEEFPKEGIHLQARCNDLASHLKRLKSKASIAESKLSFYKRWQSSLHPISIETPKSGEKNWKGAIQVRAGFCETVNIYLVADYVQPAITEGEVKDGVYEGFIVPERRVWQGLAVVGKDSRSRVVAAREITWIQGSVKTDLLPIAIEDDEGEGPVTSGNEKPRLSPNGTTEIKKVIPTGFKELSPTMPVHEGRGYAWAPAGELKKLYLWRIQHEQSGIVFLLVKEGVFWMGSPEDEKGRYDYELRHKVKITRPFYLAETEVTQAQWERVMGDNQSRFKKGGNYPVEQVSWNDVRGDINGRPDPKSFCGRTGLELPTEAQWEYACRAGTTTAIYTGELDIIESDNAPALERIAWYFGNSDGSTHPVGKKKANAWGFHDMLGNVWEWCRDRYGDYRKSEFEDPEGPSRGSSRVIRGGGWFDYARSCRSANRYGGDPSLRYDVLGFRPSRFLP